MIKAMSFEITIRNYRCFPEPLTLSIGAHLTALIGINNSGKSTILRFFYEFRSIFERLVEALSNDDLNSLINFDDKVRNQPFTIPDTVPDYQELFCDFNQGNIEFTVTWIVNDVETMEPYEIHIALTVLREKPSWFAGLKIKKNQASYADSGKIRVRGDVVEWGSILKTERSQIDSIFNSLAKTQYIAAFRNILNADPSGTSGTKNYFDLEIGRSFVGRWGRLKNGTRLEHALTSRVKEDVRRIFGFKNLEIDSWIDNQSLRLTINDYSYKLGEIGAGVAQLIVVLANAALTRPSYILIDEPELNLHPALQSDFLTSLASYASEGVIYATHNAGLAMSCADRIYTVRRTHLSSTVSVYEQTARLSEFLGELGYVAHQDLGFDKILLVEGPTEVKLISYWLRLYRLAHKVVLLPLGGSDMINGSRDAELQEIKRLSPNVFALIDSEKDQAEASLAADREAFVASCHRAAIQCFVTERRATENYFPEHAIKTALGPDFNALNEFESLKQRSVRWNKRKNWRIGAEMTIEDLKDTDLHRVFTALLA